MEDVPREQSLDEIVRDALSRIAAAMKQVGRKSVRGALEVNGVRLTLGSKRKGQRRCEECNDLPAAVAGQSKATRRVYRALRDARSGQGGGEREIWQQDIFEAIRRANPKDELSIRTVHRVLKSLCAMNQVKKDITLGFVLGAGQPTLPFCEWQSPSPSQTKGAE